MADITGDDLLAKIDAQAAGIARLELQNAALIRENNGLKRAIVPAPNRAERRRKGKDK